MISEPTHALVLPWLQLSEPIAVGAFTFLPGTQAMDRLGSRQNSLRRSTSYFFENYRVNDPCDPSAPTALVPVAPTVVLLACEDDARRVALAADALFFAMLVRNSPYAYANGTNFIQFSVPLRADDLGFARDVRTMFGSSRLATRPENAIEVRPAWCGRAHAPDENALRLCERALATRSPDAACIGECLRILISATSDSDAFERDLESSLYALALERLLHRDDQSPRKRRGKQKRMSRSLIESALSGVPRIPDELTDTPPPLGSGIVDILEFVRDERNDFWHPQPSERQHPLAEQLAIRPNLAAFRALSSLLLVCMAAAMGEPLDDHLRSYVAATEHWCSELPILVGGEPDVAIDRFGWLWAGYLIRARSPTPEPSETPQ
jgi:hypothetical protein